MICEKTKKRFGGILDSLLYSLFLFIFYFIRGPTGNMNSTLLHSPLQSRRHCGGIVFLFRERAGGRRGEQGTPFLPFAFLREIKKKGPSPNHGHFKADCNFIECFGAEPIDRASSWLRQGSSSKQRRACGAQIRPPRRKFCLTSIPSANSERGGDVSLGRGKFVRNDV